MNLAALWDKVVVLEQDVATLLEKAGVPSVSEALKAAAAEEAAKVAGGAPAPSVGQQIADAVAAELAPLKAEIAAAVAALKTAK